MNETIRTILSRRSTRKFGEAQISDAELDMLIEVARFAPSAHNGQQRHFIAVQNKDLLGRINDLCRKIYLASDNQFMRQRAESEDFCVFHNAPTVIVVCGDQTSIAPECNCALSLGNVLLAAESLGLGGCWIHGIAALQTSDEGRALLSEIGVPKGYSVYGSAAIGNLPERPMAAPRREGCVTILR